ncbi:ankyrin repeat-containing domain protein [Xylariales sp. PMI_506]|nr:ankyrin repeat-containing domain protein [Xylariales sp. PMI_506]
MATISYDHSLHMDFLDTFLPAYNSATPWFDLDAEISAKSPSSSFFNNTKSLVSAAPTAMGPEYEFLVVALCAAAAVGNVEQMRSLLVAGADINGHDENGHTPLICAIMARELEALDFLLKAGANPTLCDSGPDAKPPLFHAVDARDDAAIDILWTRGASANQRDSMEQPFFVDLVAGETPAAWIELLLEYGADACAQDSNGRPAVVLALQKRERQEDREEVVSLLLRHGAKPDSQDLDGSALISLCLHQKRDELVHVLLELGADPNTLDASDTPLLIAAIKSHDRKLAKSLLERGANPNARTTSGSHALLTVLGETKFSAADKEDLVEMLLRRGADVARADSRGATALDYALSAPSTTAVDVNGMPTPPASPGNSSNFKIPMMLLRHGADPNQCLTKQLGQPTVLTYSIDRAQHDLVELALCQGANPNLADQMERTPLSLALSMGDQSEIVTLLREHGGI